MPDHQPCALVSQRYIEHMCGISPHLSCDDLHGRCATLHAWIKRKPSVDGQRLLNAPKPPRWRPDSNTTVRESAWHTTPASKRCGSRWARPLLAGGHHLGLMRQFCAGHWADPPLASTQLGALYRCLLALYELRLDANYRAYPIPTVQARQGLETMRAVLKFVRPARVRDETL